MSTIAAIATPCVPCAIGILRISGENTCKVLEKVFSKPMAEREPRRMVLGNMLDKNGTVIDSGLCVRFSAGSSYTGEEGAELYCHGSPVVMQALLESLFAAGAVQAKNGEFTQRAFLNGKMDLIQAEAVVDLIDAETAQMAQNAAAQLGGGLSRSVERIYGALMDIASRFYAVVDYPDEDIEDLARESIESTLRKSREELDALSATFERGNLMKNGIPAVILGRPNAGKSSLLNALLGYDRAIVTDIPGTTRDTVEERLVVGNRLLRLTDTAGIRATRDAVEKIGVDRAREAAGRAMVAILVLDGSAPLTPEDEEAIGLAEGVPNLVVALNKSDLPLAQDVEVLRKRFSCVIPLSAQTGEGVSTLCRAVADCFPEGLNTAGEVLTNARQKEAVSRARDAIDSARSSLERGMTPDVVLTDMEAALGALGELNGKSIREDLVQTIFSRFCVGK